MSLQKQLLGIDDRLSDLHTLIIQMVEKSTVVLTEANLINRKIEGHLGALTEYIKRERS